MPAAIVLLRGVEDFAQFDFNTRYRGLRIPPHRCLKFDGLPRQQSAWLLTTGHKCPILQSVKPRQTVRRFRKAGVDVDTKRGKGGHYLLTYRGQQTTLPVHGNVDLSPNFIRRICKQLGMDPKKILEG